MLTNEVAGQIEKMTKNKQEFKLSEYIEYKKKENMMNLYKHRSSLSDLDTLRKIWKPEKVYVRYLLNGSNNKTSFCPTREAGIIHIEQRNVRRSDKGT